MNASTNRSRIPCHVVAGPLGAGKTTTILNFLKANAGREDIAVVVNDFGQAGLDASILAEAGGSPEIRNIPGGCLCCSSIHDMSDALEAVRKRPGLDRIIIEPSGLAILRDVVPYLKRLCDELALELRPVIALLNPKRTKEDHYKSLPFFGGLVDHADILVANRTDQCTAAQLEHFREWTARLVPVKLRVLETRFGVLPPEIFELRAGTGERPERFYAPHAHAESSGGFSGAVPAVSEKAFLDCIQKWIDVGMGDAEMLRFKALLPTDAGWRLFEIAEGEAGVRGMSGAGEAQVDWITRGVVPADTVRSALEACRA